MPPTTGFKFGDIALAPLPLTDQSAIKKRTAIVVSPDSYGVHRPDIVLMAITSQVGPRMAFDCFRYRHRVGLDVALEALAEALRTRKVTIASLDEMASACRARTVLRPYLEAMAWRRPESVTEAMNRVAELMDTRSDPGVAGAARRILEDLERELNLG